MYEYIKGTYMGLNKDFIILENNGIGYRIFTSGSTMAKMPKQNENVIIFTEQIVREDFIGLYGFLTKEEIDMFKLLLTVSGVGAKAALSLMSICTVNNIKYSIISADEKNITRAPGIGKKIAQRIILELKDKINLPQGEDQDIVLSQALIEENNGAEVLAALIALGYSEREAQNAVKTIGIEDSLENSIKSCLKFLMKWGEAPWKIELLLRLI